MSDLLGSLLTPNKQIYPILYIPNCITCLPAAFHQLAIEFSMKKKSALLSSTQPPHLLSKAVIILPGYLPLLDCGRGGIWDQ